MAATSIRTVSTVVALNARQFAPESVKIPAGVTCLDAARNDWSRLVVKEDMAVLDKRDQGLQQFHLVLQLS
jgi:hypothetical protein